MPTVRRHPLARSRSAFTLVEAIATIAIVATLSVLSSRLILEGASRFSDATIRVDLHNQASGALDRIVQDLRSMQKDSGSTVVPSIASGFTATSVTFNDSAGTATTISYDPSTSIVSISQPGVTSTLLSNCTAFSLAYADKDNATVSPGSSRDNIRRITISLTVTRSGISESLRTKIYIRAMMAGSGAA